MKEKNLCPHCGGETAYSARYDALFCPRCDVWWESTCADPASELCAQRPEKPSQANREE